jgi:hypothetical protein
MKLVIGATEYPLGNINEATLDDLMMLRKQTGLGMKGLREKLQLLDKFDDPEDILDDPDALLAMGALVWLARRKAGEVLTLEQACDFPLHEMQFVEEPDDVAVADDVDPKSSTGSSEGSTTT